MRDFARWCGFGLFASSCSGGPSLSASQHRQHSCPARSGRALGLDLLRAPAVPAVERIKVARVPGLAQTGGAQVPVGTDLLRDRAKVVPEVDDRRPAPEPV